MGRGSRNGFGGSKKDRIGNVYAEHRNGDRSHLQVFLKALPYLWPRNQLHLRVLLVLSMLFMIISSACELYAPIPMRQIVEELTPSTTTTSSAKSSINFSMMEFLLFCLATIGGAVTSRLRDMCFAGVGAETERSISLDSFRHLQQLSLSFHQRRETGAILRSISRGAGTYSALIKSTIFILLPMLIKVVFICIIFAVLFKWYFFVIIIISLIWYTVYSIITSTWRDSYRRMMNEKDNERNNKVFDTLLNFETMKYFNAEQHEEKQFNGLCREFADAQVKTQNVYSLTSLGQSLIAYSGIVLILCLAGYQVVSGQLKLADFVMIHQYLQNLYQPLEQLGKLYLDLKQQILDAEAMFLLLEEPIEIKDKDNALELYISPSEQAEIEFRNVSFSYQKNKDGPKIPLIHDLSFTIKAGERVAIVGPSGVGKSTLTRLLCRLYDADHGTILVNGIDITDIQQDSFRRYVAIVPQDSVLFNNTIAYNIGYGCVTHDATIDQIIDVSKRAAIHPFIAAQPNGYETPVGERGIRLSGGEKQRVSIARAVLKNPKIMIFDEATSSLDSITESEILTAMNDIAKGRTCLTIAHRLSTVMDSDKILVLKKGTMVEMGTHDQLLKIDNGVYRSLWNQQQRIDYLKKDLKAVGQLDDETEDEIAAIENEQYHSHDDRKEEDEQKRTPPVSSTDVKQKLSESFPSKNRYSTFENQPDIAKADKDDTDSKN